MRAILLGPNQCLHSWQMHRMKQTHSSQTMSLYSPIIPCFQICRISAGTQSPSSKPITWPALRCQLTASDGGECKHISRQHFSYSSKGRKSKRRLSLRITLHATTFNCSASVFKHALHNSSTSSSIAVTVINISPQ